MASTEYDVSLALLAFKRLVGSFYVDPSSLQLEHELSDSEHTIVEWAWLEESSGNRREVAVKTLRPHFLSSPQELRAFAIEAQRLSQLRHRFLVPVLGLGCYHSGSLQEVSTSTYLVEEYAGPMSLAKLITTHGLHPGDHTFAYKYKDAVRWLAQLAEALAYLHSEGIWHGDVRCQNIYVTNPDLATTDVRLGDLKPHRASYLRPLDAPLLSLQCYKNNLQQQAQQAQAGSPQQQQQQQQQQPLQQQRSYRLKAQQQPEAQQQQQQQEDAQGQELQPRSRPCSTAGAGAGASTASGDGQDRPSGKPVQAGSMGSKVFRRLSQSSQEMLEQVSSSLARGVPGPSFARYSWSMGAGPSLHMDLDRLDGLKKAYAKLTSSRTATSQPAAAAPGITTTSNTSLPSSGLFTALSAPIGAGVGQQPQAMATHKGRVPPHLGSGFLMAISSPARTQPAALAAPAASGLGRCATAAARSCLITSVPSHNDVASPLGGGAATAGGTGGGSSTLLSRMFSTPMSIAGGASVPSLASGYSPGSSSSGHHVLHLGEEPAPWSAAFAAAVQEHEAAKHARAGRQGAGPGFQRASYTHGLEWSLVRETIPEDDESRGVLKHELQAQVESVWNQYSQATSSLPSDKSPDASVSIRGGCSAGKALAAATASPGPIITIDAVSVSVASAGACEERELASSSADAAGTSHNAAAAGDAAAVAAGAGAAGDAAVAGADAVACAATDAAQASPFSDGAAIAWDGAPASVSPKKKSKRGVNRVSFSVDIAAGKLASRDLALIYAAPEYTTANQLSAKTDVFAFGKVAWQLLWRSLVDLHGATAQQQWAEIQKYAAKVAQGYREEVPSYWPKPLRDIVTACWAQDPDARPEMSQVAAQLNEVLNDEGFISSLDAAEAKHDRWVHPGQPPGEVYIPEAECCECVIC